MGDPRGLTSLVLLTGVLACGDAGDSSATGSGTLATMTGGGPSGATELPTTSEGTSGSGTASASTGTGVPTTTEAVDPSTGSSSGGEIKLDLGAQADFGVGCDCGMASEFSYIWVSNSPESTVSKIETLPSANCGEYGRIQAVG